MSANPSLPNNRTLPPKEYALFKRILKCYEHKLYKNGLKFAKQILGNGQFAEHAETLAMKGLILNALGRREEAYEYVRRGLRNDLKSHTCWHVYGLLQRSERKYDEAIKCYRNALKWDSANVQILRELSIVQVHTRDLVGYRDTRNTLFQLKPAHRASWIGLAMSYHLLKDYDMSFKILDAFSKTLTIRDSYDYEKSELLLYQSAILEESGDLQSAKKFLLDHERDIYDKYTFHESICRLYLNLGEYGRAEAGYRKLLSMNQEDGAYYEGLAKAMQIADDPAAKLQLYRNVERQYPRAYLPKRLPLDCAEGEEFLTYLRPYLAAALDKGTPSLFTDIKPMYQNPAKVIQIGNLVESMANSLRDYGKFSKDDEKVASASALLWTYYYLAQHYDYHRDTDTALAYIEKAIEHTPTLIELFMCKGRIYKHMGDMNTAAQWMDEARELDTADRFINSKSAKYQLRANRVEAAAAVCGKFTREGASPMENLNEMQCMWFQTECALAYQRLGQLGDALKKCHEVDRHFTEIIDDQYDFHSYCLRKMTLRSYMELLRLEDVLRAHPFYFKAARCAIEVYIHLYDHPLQNKSADEQISPVVEAVFSDISIIYVTYAFQADRRHFHF
ncbi:N-alpha-acetyltransferase 16, NatA auxiliary subunit [Folsomia candida]|uniref:N-alpha-acetyltransferase 16, NatA auxiliary subunit n=1 Tax=Folsomia candida TaxID=158441 RepID=A0A226DJY4_FOLCA|nr:N-alpha-acetyltransferase 16, NatA auxiliary subunit [Folsomia candida]